MTPVPSPRDCGDFEAMVDELAVGVVGEPTRSALLGHASTCASCRSLLRETTDVAELLLHLAPDVEPAAGFESRAVARMVPPAERSTRRWAAVAAVAAVLIVLLGAGALLLATDGRPTTTAAIVTASGDDIGVVELNSRAARVVITIEPDDWKGTWICQLRDGDRWVDVGHWTAADAHGGVWATAISHELTDATAMRILGAGGRVIATSEFD